MITDNAQSSIKNESVALDIYNKNESRGTFSEHARCSIKKVDGCSFG